LRTHQVALFPALPFHENFSAPSFHFFPFLRLRPNVALVKVLRCFVEVQNVKRQSVEPQNVEQQNGKQQNGKQQNGKQQNGKQQNGKQQNGKQKKLNKKCQTTQC
jgi:hypothetical protein